MTKHKAREAREAEQAALDQHRQEEERLKAEAKGKKKKDRKGKGRENTPVVMERRYESEARERNEDTGISPINRAPDLPPMLEFSPEKAPTQELPSQGPDTVVSGSGQKEVTESESESEEDVPLSQVRQTSRSRPSSLYPKSLKAPTEEESSNEDGDVPLARLRRPNPLPTSTSTSKPTLALATDFGPGINLDQPPLSATGSLGLNVPVPQSASEMTKPTTEEVGEDDDVPLLLRQAHIKSLAPPRSADNDDDDDVPLGVRQSMLLATSPSGFMPPNPAMYAQGQGHMYGGHQYQHPASMYGYAPYGHQPMPHQMQMPMHGWPQMPMPMGYPPPPPPPNMGLGMGHMSFPDLSAMMQAQGQGFPNPDVAGAGAGLQSGNIDSWRKGVDPAVAPPPSVGGASRRS
jgi:hypothetical protein